jgi:hypothetical protein
MLWSTSIAASSSPPGPASPSPLQLPRRHQAASSTRATRTPPRFLVLKTASPAACTSTATYGRSPAQTSSRAPAPSIFSTVQLPVASSLQLIVFAPCLHASKPLIAASQFRSTRSVAAMQSRHRCPHLAPLPHRKRKPAAAKCANKRHAC